MPDECILCGMCFVTCPQNAKEIRDDIHLVEEATNAGKPVYASVAPSFIADFDVSGIAEMEKALIKLGFAGAEETAIGADLVKREYQKLVDSGKHRAIISSCCHSINLLIQKYYPTMLPYLDDVLSPMQAHCKLMKEQHPGAVTVFIGPCISKKDEAAGSAHTDIAVSYTQLDVYKRQDLTFSIRGIGSVKCDGERNIPDGEVYTAPVRDSVNGTITFTTPSFVGGFRSENIWLTFKDGKIVDCGSNDTDRMNAYLDTDEGARYVGEFAIGVNPNINQSMGDTLFDRCV